MTPVSNGRFLIIDTPEMIDENARKMRDVSQLKIRLVNILRSIKIG
jgi:hypothetical protein